jgi:iron(III) transport system permease protein
MTLAAPSPAPAAPRRLRWRPRTDAGGLGALTAAALVLVVVALPFAALLGMAAGSSGDTWPHLLSTVLPGSTLTTLILMAGVGCITAVVGVACAWLVTMCRFPGRTVLQVALVLPLAVPVYIAAYCYVEILDFAGPIQRAVRALFGFRTLRDYWFPEVRTLPGAIFCMSAVLFPYVYMTVRVLFLMQSARMIDVARTLGASPARMFWSVALPLSRPAIAVGVSLALMETINDIGAVEFFGVRTLTFSIYQTWLNRSDLVGAAQLACVVLVFVFALIAMERAARGRQRYASAGGRHPLPGFHLTGWRAAAAFLACFLPVLFGFLLPGWLMLDYASRRAAQFADPALHSAILHSLGVAGATAVLAVAAGLVLVYAVRLSRSRLVAGLARFSAMGYAVPGTVLAVGILYPLAAFDNSVDATAKALFGIGTGLLLTGSGGAIIYACLVRFLAIAHGTLEAGMSRVTEHLDMAARTLGRTPRQVLWEIHVPLMRRAMVAAGLLVFVDTMKELSATILLRPFNFETLATFIFSKASRGFFEDASAASLVIVAIGIIPLILLLGLPRADPLATDASRTGLPL